MKNMRISIVDSISEEIEQVHSRIRERAYARFLSRGSESNGELEDWLEAERELVSVITPTLSDENQQTIAELEMPEIDAKKVSILVTSRDALVRADDASSRPIIAVIHFAREVRPADIRAQFNKNTLRIVAPFADVAAQTLEQTA
jgi:HSP20 family molecular chaperone IbpA